MHRNQPNVIKALTEMPSKIILATHIKVRTFSAGETSAREDPLLRLSEHASET